MIKVDYSNQLAFDYRLYCEETLSDNVLKSFFVSSIISPIFKFNRSIAFTNKLGNRNFKNYYPIMTSALTSLKSSYTS